MIVTNYPNLKNPQETFDFRDHQPIQSKKTKKQKNTTEKQRKKSIDKGNGKLKSPQEQNPVSKQQKMSKTHGSTLYQQKQKNNFESAVNQKNQWISQTEYGNFYQNNDPNKYLNSKDSNEIYYNYDQNEEIRKKQIEKEWQNRVSIVQQHQQDYDEEKEYLELQKQVYELSKYKNWCEKVFKCSSKSEEFQKLNKKLDNEKQFQAHIEADQKTLEKKLAKYNENYKHQDEKINKKKQQIQEIKQKINQINSLAKLSNDEAKMIKQNTELIQNKMNGIYQEASEFVLKKQNKKSTNKKAVISMLTQAYQEISKVLQDIQK
ncbi:hypothetical protein PPERSA_09936 [Pseudocohnilembus persalinus]|uniref:Uncharacterized protein n=1 Tax=Pseudocohnilembus persalinus TaxID=266149 RepID=A0A0V0QJ40_PSEPJ|nr:hypothetical protein PPERSA_09936 [Pseudocohnilembus persalinus]|eukprot:KRX02319.1 hypothetical protein PPERSA_09936 [Pseudocohnilembus persalinus]